MLPLKILVLTMFDMINDEDRLIYQCLPASGSADGSGVFPVGVFLPVDFLPGDERPDCGVFLPAVDPALPDLAVDFRELAAFFSAASAMTQCSEAFYLMLKSEDSGKNCITCVEKTLDRVQLEGSDQASMRVGRRNCTSSLHSSLVCGQIT